MNKKNLTLLLLITTFFSCVSEIKEEIVDDVPSSKGTSAPFMTRSSGNTAVTYEKVPNPYSLKVMQKIYDDYSIAPVTLEPTDLYVCFKPQDSTQFRILHNNPELELFEYPLDIVLPEGEEFLNPELGDNDLPWTYTTVKPDFEFPEDVPYEVLDTCYIPNDGETIAQTRTAEIDVEAIALGRMGYEIDTLDVLTKAPLIRPSGRIRVEQDTTFVPVKGVKIRCYNGVKWATGYTDESGHYSLNKSFKTNIHYAIVYENSKDFDLWGNINPIGRANLDMDWHSPNGYSVDIPETGYAWEWSLVNNYAYDYYTMCVENGIKLPPSNLKIWVIRNAKSSSAPMLRRINKALAYNGHDDALNSFINIIYGNLATAFNLLLRLGLPDITIGTKSKTYDDIYKSVHHELSHASHFSKVGDSFWAEYVSYIMTYGAYGNGTGKNAELCGIGEMWGYFMGYIQKNEFLGRNIEVGNYPGYVVDGWIKPHALWDLYADNTLTKKQIYDCLTPEVDTYADLIEKMIRRYPSKADAIKLSFARHELYISDVNACRCPSPDRIEFDTPFEITWTYATDQTLHDIEFTFVKEKYFDGSSDRNITINKNSKSSARVSISQSGYYIIEARVKGTDLKKYFHIAKHDKPEYSLPGSEMGEGTEPLTKLGTKTGNPYTVSVSFGTNSTLRKRLIALTRVNYRQMTANFDFRRIDVRLVHAEQDTLKAKRGDSSVIALPELYNYIYEETIYDPVDSDAEHLPEYVTYTTKSHGYYTISYPEDISKWVN